MKWLNLCIGFLLFIAFLFIGENSLLYNAIGLAAWMVYWWITECVPLYATALLPILLGPPLGLIDTKELAQAYGHTMVFLFLGGFLIALAIEKWNVHRKIASMIVQQTGSTPAGVLLGFILSTAFLSMWLSNTGTAIMMMPMAMTVVSVLPESKFSSRFSTALLLSIAFAANIGGTATLIGSPPNVQMSGILADNFNIQVDFLSWIVIGLPFSVLLLIALFFYLRATFLKTDEHVEIAFRDNSPWSTNQKRVLIVFFLTAVLWIVKQFINKAFDWSVTDTQIAILGGILLFIIPSKGEDKKTGVLKWEDTKNLPWGILLLFGGGLALAKALSNAGVLSLFADWVSEHGGDSYFWLLFILIVAGVFLTELMSNLALVTILIPIIAELAIKMDYPVLALCLPVTLSASCAFMLPMATPPNAIVFSSGKLRVSTMAKVGVIMNIISVAAVLGVAYILTLV